MEQQRRGELKADFYPRIQRLMDRRREYGIDGIECYHPSASDEEAEWLSSYAADHGLLVTRGTDFHLKKYPRTFARINWP